MSKMQAVFAEQLSERRLSSRWKSAVFPMLPDSRRVALEDCGSMYRHWVCNKDSSHEGVTRIGCKDPLCYVCSTARKIEQVDDKMELLDRTYAELHEPVACSGLTFTIPKDGWSKIPEALLPALEGIAQSVLNDYFGGERVTVVQGQKKVPRYVIGGDLRAQGFHSYSPDKKGNVYRGFAPHVHAAVYSMMYDRLGEVFGLEGVSYGCYVKRTLSLSRAEVRKMCFQLAQAWRSAVESYFGFHSVAREWVVNYRYYPTRNDTRHWIDYMFRSEVQDAYREVCFNGSVPQSGEEQAWFNRMFSIRKKGSHLHTGFGWMSNAVLNKYVKRLGIAFKRKSERMKERRIIPCFKCDGIMISNWMDRSLDRDEVVSRSIPFLVSDGWIKRGS